MNIDFQKIFYYDPVHDLLMRRATRRPAGITRKKKGNHVYSYVTHAGKRYPAHRVVWAVYRGVWPEGTISHLDGDRSNNRIANLYMK